MLWRVRISARQQDTHIRDMCHTGPDLLLIDDKIIAVLDRPGLQRGQIRAGVRLRKALAPDLLGTQNAWNIALFLLLCPVYHQRRTNDHQPESVGHRRRLGSRQFLLEDRLLQQCCTTPAIRFRPVNTGPASIEHFFLPGPRIMKSTLRVTRHRLLGDIGFKPGPYLLPKCLGGIVKTHIHTRLLVPRQRSSSGPGADVPLARVPVRFSGSAARFHLRLEYPHTAVWHALLFSNRDKSDSVVRSRVPEGAPGF